MCSRLRNFYKNQSTTLKFGGNINDTYSNLTTKTELKATEHQVDIFDYFLIKVAFTKYSVTALTVVPVLKSLIFDRCVFLLQFVGMSAC